VVAEVDLADPGCGVEEEGEPADPGPELDPADCLDAVREVHGGFEDFGDCFHGTGFDICVPVALVSKPTRVKGKITYFEEINMRSSTAHVVIPTVTRKNTADKKVNCLNCESPKRLPKILSRSIVPMP